VIDRDGLPALSMRTVAAELDRRTMALYRYVDDREELECLVVDLVLAPVLNRPGTTDGEGRAGPRASLTELAERMRGAVSAHPGILPLAVRHRQNCFPALRWSERVLTVLEQAGRQETERLTALRALLAYLIGALELEHHAALAGPGTARIAALPADTFPLLSRTAATARTVDADLVFRTGLDALLDGLGIA
jgi:AcrR family transcriptional regulator